METFWNIGASWIIFFQSMGNWMEIPMRVFSFFGTEEFYLFLLPALYWSIDASIGLRVGIILLLNISINDAFKMSFHAPRPYWYNSAVKAYTTETSFGLPSGHAQIATGVWGMIAAQIRKWWAWLAAGLVILLIGLSRLYLGVHFPHDVVVGWLCGGIILWLVLRLWNPTASWLKKLNLGQQILAVFITSLIMILIELIPYLWIKVTCWQPPQAWAQYTSKAVTLNGAFTSAGTLFGLAVGFALLNQRGRFSARGPAWKRAVRFLIGLVGVAILYLGLDAAFGLIAPDAEAWLPYILRYLRYALVGAWISAGAPLLFIILHLAEPCVGSNRHKSIIKQ